MASGSTSQSKDRSSLTSENVSPKKYFKTYRIAKYVRSSSTATAQSVHEDLQRIDSVKFYPYDNSSALPEWTLHHHASVCLGIDLSYASDRRDVFRLHGRKLVDL